MLFREIGPPLSPSREPDYGLPAAVLAAAVALALAVLASYMALASRLMHDHPLLAGAAITAGAVLPSTGAFLLARRILERHGLYLWQSLLVAAGLVAVVCAAPGWAFGLFPRADDRYERELAGPGRCLHGTPYALDRARTTFSTPADGRRQMTVTPLGPGLRPLRLDNAVDGGWRRLQPADRATRLILDAHGC